MDNAVTACLKRSDDESTIEQMKAQAQLTAHEIGKVVNVILGGTNRDEPKARRRKRV
jgi:hypothetical protein